MKLASPKSKTPDESLPDMQYENFGKPIWVIKDNDPRFRPIKPMVLESSSELELNPESMHPNIVPGRGEFPILKISDARLPSIEVPSAYEIIAWQSLLGSHEAGTGSVRVRVLHTGEEHGIRE